MVMTAKLMVERLRLAVILRGMRQDCIAGVSIFLKPDLRVFLGTRIFEPHYVRYETRSGLNLHDCQYG